MNNLIQKTTRAIALVTVFSMMVAMAPVHAATIMDGDLVKAAGSSSVYMIAGSSKRVFPHYNVYLSWGYPANFSTVKTISAADLASYTDGDAVPFRDGSLFRGTASSLHGKEASAVFVVSNGKLMPVQSGEIYQALYNDASFSRVTWVPDDLLSKFNYPLGDNVTSSATHPDGSLIRYTGTSQVYLISGGQKRAISAAGLASNRYSTSSVINVAASEAYADGAAVATTEMALVTPATWSGTTPTTPVVGGALTVALASDNPASATVISDNATSGADGAQSMIPFIKINFTAGSGDVKVTTLKLHRSGISSDSDLSAVYLYDGSTKIADYNSIVDRVVTFTKSAGLFTVKAGTTKAITVKGDITDTLSSGKTISLSVSSASDVTTDGATVSGSAMGNAMSSARVDDIGKLTVAAVAVSTTMDPGTTDKELWKFTAAAADQEIQVEKIKLTMVGTAATADLANFKLYDGSTQLGSTVAAMDADKTISFDISGYKIKSGNTRTITLKGDVVSGTSRNFYFSIENMHDLTAKDTNYGIYIKPNQADSWTIIRAATATTINTGDIVNSVNTASPSGNVSLTSTDIEIARFDFKATGEDMKIMSLPVTITLGAGGNANYARNIKNVKLVVDGTQIGTTDSSMTSGTAETFSLGNTFIVPANTTKTLVVKADIDEATATPTTSDVMTNNQTVQVSLGAGSSNVRGMVSSSSDSTTAASGYALTIKEGSISVAKNISMANYSSGNPTGVTGTTEVKIGSFVITAGAAEGVDLTQIVLGDKTGDTEYLGEYYQNLKIKNGTTQIGSTVGTLTSTADTTYTFTPSTAISLAAGQTYMMDVYADILSGLTGTPPLAATSMVKLSTISYTTKVTNNSTSWSTGVDGQNNYIAASGSLAITVDGSNPTAKQIVAGATDEVLAVLKFTAGSEENVNIQKLTLTDTTSYPGSISNIRIYDGSTLVGTVATLSGDASPYTAEFNLATPLVITRSSGYAKSLTVKADVPAYPNAAASASDSHLIKVSETAAQYTIKGAVSGVAVTPTYTQNAVTHTVYRTKLTAALNSASPSGASVPSASQTVMKLDLTADAAYDVNINTITFTASSNDATVINSEAYTLWDWTDTQIASGTLTTGSVTMTPTAALVIPKGTTKTIYLKGSSADAGENDSLQISIGSTGISWNDNGANTTVTTTKTLPIYGGTFTY